MANEQVSGGTRAPELSLIITAYDRREFVKEALESALRQTLTRDRFEIILIKNFEERALDSFTAANGIRTIFCNEQSIGNMMWQALESSRGAIVTLLDDDDTFFRDKLECVLDVMKDGTVGYYHNGVEAIGLNGRHVRSPLEAIRHLTILSSSSSATALLRAIDKGGTFNSSSISFRREVAETWCSVIKCIPTGPGFSLFVASLLAGKKNVVDPRRLTKYRIRPTDSRESRLSTTRTAIENALHTLRIISSTEMGETLAAVLNYKECELNSRLYLYGSGPKRHYCLWYASGLLAARTTHKPLFRTFLALLVYSWPILPHYIREHMLDSGIA